MKIIDLFVKIANSEKVPEKIKYRNKIYEYNKLNNQYYEIGKKCQPDYALRNCLYDFRMLNDEIEIINGNDELEIIKTDKITYDDMETDKDDEYFIEISDLNNELICIGEKCSDETKVTLYLIRKINNLIYEINKLKGEK